jgi:hypothetical protein
VYRACDRSFRWEDGRRHGNFFAREKEEFLRKFLKLEGGLPSHDTFGRLFRLPDPEQFRAFFQRFTERFAQACQGVIAIDGKLVRRSFDKASQKSALPWSLPGDVISVWYWRESLPTRSQMRLPPFPSC